MLNAVACKRQEEWNKEPRKMTQRLWEESLMKRVLALDSVKEGFCSSHLHHWVGWLLLNHPLFTMPLFFFFYIISTLMKSVGILQKSLKYWQSGFHILSLAFAYVRGTSQLLFYSQHLYLQKSVTKFFLFVFSWQVS